MRQKPTISRRMFLRLAALAGIGAGAAFIHYRTASVGTINFLRWVLRGQLNRLNPPAVVALGSCPSYEEDILSVLRQLWSQAEMPDIRGKRILVKPNLVDCLEGHPSSTSPRVVGAVIDLLRELGAGELAVGDGSAFRRDTQAVAEACGLLDELTKRQVPFIDLNYDDLQPVKARDGWFRHLNWLWLPAHALEADYIVSLPKLKTHHWTGVSLSLKNLLGVVPGSRYGWPKNIIHINAIHPSILGVYQSLPPVLSIIDGIIGMEGDGPMFGTQVQHGLLAVGKDPVAVDSICVQLMGFQAEQIAYLNLAVWSGIGQGVHIETRGTPAIQLQRKYQSPPSMKS